MKFIKDNCEIKKEQRWALCTNGSQGPQMDRIQRPFPNKETFRYKSVFEFPSTCLDRKTMSVDDFMPRAQIKKYFQGCTLTAPGRLTRPTFGLGRLKKNTGRPAGHPALMLAVQRCGRAGD